MVFKPSEHRGAIFRLLRDTQIECVGVSQKDLHMYINAYHMIQNFILNPNMWSKNITPTHLRENRYLKICVGGFGKFLLAKKLSSNSDS